MLRNKKTILVALLAAFALFVSACGTADEAVEAGTDAAEAGADAVEDAVEDGADAADDAMEDGDDAAMPGAGVTVTAARANWSTGYFQAAVYSALLTELGYEVTDPALNEFPPSNGYTAMAEGEIDFWANSWYPGHLSWHENELTDGSLVGDKVEILGEQMLGEALEGFLVTKTVAEENSITSLQQINDDPDLVALFDEDDNGKANIFGCPEDWTCDDIINEMIEFNSWDNLEQTQAGYDAMIAESVNRANAGDPVIQYTWSPSGYLGQLIPGDNALWLNVGDETNILDGSITPDWDFTGAGPVPTAAGTCTADPCYLGWEFADIQVTANKEFVDANPAAKALFEAVTLNVIDVVNQNVTYQGGANSEDDVKAQAQEWIDANRDTVDPWLDAARAAA